MRQNIEIEEMQSGEDDVVLWISFGFRSELSENDILFIVCGKEINEQDKRLGMDEVYFERLDQINSCYNAAERISVSEGAVDIDFTENGCRELKLSKLVRFDCKSVTSEFSDACIIFRKMIAQEWAKTIQFAKC